VNEKNGEGEEIMESSEIDVKFHNDECAMTVRFPGTPSEEVDE